MLLALLKPFFFFFFLMMKKIVIKIGTSSLSNGDGSINKRIIEKIALTTTKLMWQGYDILIVTSGAVGCGKSIINKYKNDELYLRNDDIAKSNRYSTIDKTVLSAIGQIKLMSYYISEFEKHYFSVGQLLIAGPRDIESSYCIKSIETFFKTGIVPIVNANDTVYDKEISEDENNRFSDNDMLAAELSRAIGADMLILITNVDGYIYNNEVIDEIKYGEIDSYITMTDNKKSTGGTGGMKSKLNACKVSGCDTFIIHNSQITNIDKLINGEYIGTKVSKNISKVYKK